MSTPGNKEILDFHKAPFRAPLSFLEGERYTRSSASSASFRAVCLARVGCKNRIANSEILDTPLARVILSLSFARYSPFLLLSLSSIVNR